MKNNLWFLTEERPKKEVLATLRYAKNTQKARRKWLPDILYLVQVSH
jgi:hypothetical protein